MANWSDLKAAVSSIIKTNGAQEITGQLLQNVLNNIISNVGANSTFAGIATSETNPGTPDGNVFYLATKAGIYSNFNSIVIEAGEAVILEWKGSWVKKELGFATNEKLSELGSKVDALKLEVGKVSIQSEAVLGVTFRSKYIEINGKTGESFKIEVYGDSVTDKLVYIYGTNNKTTQVTDDVQLKTIYLGNEDEAILSSDCQYIYAYINSTNVTNSGIVTLSVERDVSINRRIEKLKVEVENHANALELLKPIPQELEDIKSSIGDVTYEKYEKEVSMTDAVQGAASKSMKVGSAEHYTSSESYSRREFLCEERKEYHIITKCYGAGEGNYLYFIHVLNKDNVVIQALASREEDKTDFYLTINEGGVRVVVSSYERVENNTSKAYKCETKSLVDFVNDVDKKIESVIVKEGQDVDSSYYNKYIASSISLVVGQKEDAIVNEALDKISNLNSEKRCLNFAFITDTHNGGTYLDEKNMSSIRSIEAFKKLSKNEMIDFCVHGGDVATSYGMSWKQYIGKLKKSMQHYKGIVKSFFICKGNHDAVNNGSDPTKVLVDLPDWGSNTYYIIADGTFADYVEITKDEWDGISNLYTDGSRQDKLLPDSEFYKYSNAWAKNTVKDANNPDGCYYYADFDLYKVRVVVLNPEQVSNTHSFCSSEDIGMQLQWFSNHALNLTGKENPSDWHVLTLQHISFEDYIQSESRPFRSAIISILDAFKKGISVEGSIGDYSFNFDFSQQGLGNYIGNIHGHEHGYKYSNIYGFNDIGFTLAARDLNTLGNDNNYGLDIITVDVSNRKLYDIVVSKEIGDREYYW